MKDISKYIPLDKSWIIRMAILDLVNNQRERALSILDGLELGEDLIALKRALLSWESSKVVDIGESGTLYRFLQFVSWKEGLNKVFVKNKTLKDRKITDNPEIVNFSAEKLLKLDEGTSQWASAAALCGDRHRIKNPPYKLKLTYEALDIWDKNKAWEPKHDENILNQAEIFLKLLKRQKTGFVPNHSEDYCFARAFQFVDEEEGKKKWPSLKGHESNRIEEMEKALKEYNSGKIVSSKDHRVVQALAMKGKVECNAVRFKYPECVYKTWPRFWEFMNYVDQR